MSVVLSGNDWGGQFETTILLQPIVDGDNLWESTMYQLNPNAVGGKIKYNIAGGLGRILAANSDCSPTEKGTLTLTQNELDLNKIGAFNGFCADAFNDSVFETIMARGTDYYDLDATQVVQNLIVERVGKATVDHTFDIAWFGGDVSMTTTADIAAATYGTGFFQQGESASAVQKVSISSTTAGLASGETLSVLREMYNASKPLLSAVGDPGRAVIMCTTEFYQNLLETYENTGTDSGLTKLSEGGGIAFRGIELVQMVKWSTTIAELGSSLTHRAVLTTRDNLVVGSDIATTSGNVKYWYDINTNKYKYRFNFEFGVKIIHDELFVYARG